MHAQETTIERRAAPAEPARTAPRAGALAVAVHRDDAARDLLAADSFRAAWDDLAARCPWTTAFQRRAFAECWFEHYGDLWRPVVVTGTGEDGRLDGLLVLALGPDGRRLHVAGAGQCEHQAWLADPSRGDAFVVAALDRLAADFPRGALTFLRLPAGTPLGWVDANPRWARRARTDDTPWYFRDLGDGEPDSASKKWNRRSLRQLAEHGDVEFSEIRTPEEFAAFLAEFALHHDFRHEGAYGTAEFAADPRKGPFHEALFRAGFLRAFALRVGGRLAAGGTAFPDGDVIRQGPHAYCAELSRHQASKHLLHDQFARFRADGFRTYDLSPGPGYKERYATRSERSVNLRLRFSALGAARERARLRAESLAKRVALALGTTPDRMREAARLARARGPLGVAAATLRRAAFFLPLREERVVTVYALDATRTHPIDGPRQFRRDSVEDLLRFAPAARSETRRAFLATALERLAAGHHVYTRVEDGVLVCRGWVAPGGGTSSVSEVGADIPVPDDVAVLYDFVTHPSHRRRGHYTRALREMLDDAVRDPEVRDVWIGVEDANVASRGAVERLGWKPVFALRRTKRFGRVVAPPASRALHAAPCGAAAAVQAAKRGLYRAARACGLFRLARRLTRDELRILCWHGFEIDGEHEFAPRLFMRTATLERRLEWLARGRWNVLRLDDAVERMRRGELPPDSVVLTIDDGAASVPLRAAEPLRKSGFPWTLYVTTYYVMRPRPVFQTALGYLLWRTDRRELDLEKLGPYLRGTLRLDDPNAVAAFAGTMVRYAKRRLDESGRQELGRRLATWLGLDWADMETTRRCSLATFQELRDLRAAGADLQLHTHRHRFPPNRDDTVREIADNRDVLRRIGADPCEHLCYPSGEHHPSQFAWLRELGVKSATTCVTGLNPPRSEPLALRRFLDGDCVSDVEFEAEMSGFADLARRALRRVGLLGGRAEPYHDPADV